MATKTADIASKESRVFLPLEPLFTLLHNNGFKVKPDDYVEMLKVTERFGSADIDETAKWICPIVATSEGEQVKFYNLIEEYKKLFREDKDTKKDKIHLWQKIVFPIVVAGIIFAIYYFSSRPDPLFPGNTNIYRTVRMGDTVMLNTSELFYERIKDSAKVKVQWHFQDGETRAGMNIVHIFTKPGENRVIREFSSEQLPLAKKTDTAFIYVCSDIPLITFDSPALPFFTDSSFSLTASVTSPGKVSSYQWKINDSTITTTTPELRNIRLSAEGSYDVELTAIVGDAGSPCYAIASQSILVQQQGVNYNSAFTHFIPKVQGGQTTLKWWVHAALILPAVTGLFYSLFKRKRDAKKAKKTRRRRRSAETQGREGTKVRQVYDIPFERSDLRLVQPDRDLRMVLLQMRMKAEEENLVLNVPGTINSIIRAGGSPQLVYTPQTRQQDYLILIDRSNPKSLMNSLFEYLVGSMQESGIPLTCFYYDKQFNCTNKQHPFGMSLKRLSEIHGKSTLIIMGKAHELVYRAYPVIEEKFHAELQAWEHKAIITPVPSCDWDSKEKVLLEHFVLLPADILSLQKLIPALKEKVKLKQNQIEDFESKPYSTLYVDFRDVEKLKAYLGNDEVMFQWICATTVYPRLRWEVLIEVGKAILDKYGQPEKLNYNNLLRICRISWMQEGVFPQSTRLELLKQLTVENEIVARETLQRMLLNVSILYKGTNYVFEEERKRQQLTNEFILFSNNSKAYPQFVKSEEIFKKLWADDAIMDGPVKKYLSKPAGSDWQTPVQVNNVSVGVPAFFQMEEKKDARPVQIKRFGAAVISFLLIALWIYLAFWGGAQKVPGVKLYQYRSNAPIEYQLAVAKDFSQCNDSTGKYFDELVMSVNMNNNSYPAVYNNKTGLAKFSIPYGDFNSGEGQLTVAWNNNADGGVSANRSITTSIDFSAKEIPDSFTVTCANPTPGPTPNPTPPNPDEKWTKLSLTDIPASLREIWKGESANRLAFIDLPNNRLYYSTQGKGTYGTYRIIAFYRNNDNYQLVTAGDAKQFRTFYLRNITPSSFEFAVCPMSYTENINDSKDTVVCGGFERMTYYYERNPINIYLPLVSGEMVASELSKLRKVIKDTLLAGSNDLLYNVYINQNTQNSRGIDYLPMVKRNLQSNGIVYPGNAPERVVLVGMRNATPFSRNYIQFNGNYRSEYDGKIDDYKDPKAAEPKTSNAPVEQAKRPGPDCSIVYTSMDDVYNYPPAICRLDLSKAGLKALPEQLQKCVNMQELNLGETSIPESTIQLLQRALPKCKIIYTIAKTTTEQPANFALNRTITFKAPGEVPKTDISYINSLVDVLSQYPKAKVKLVGYYSGDGNKKTATVNVQAIRKLLTQSKMFYNTDQVVEEYVDESLRKKGTASVYPNFIFTTQLGSSGDETESEPTSKVDVFISGFPPSVGRPVKR